MRRARRRHRRRSHEPDARELDAALFARAQVIVEDRATALREAGDIVLAIADGTLDAGRLVPMRDIVTGNVDVATDRPVVFKGTGMAWQDLAVARAVVGRAQPLIATAPADPSTTAA